MDTSSNIQSGLLGFIYQFYSEMKSHETIIVYEGEVSHELMKTFASVAEKKMAAKKEEMQVRQRVYHVMVECLQNITLHSRDEEHAGEQIPGQHILMVTRSAEHYHVLTGNPVSNAKAARLKDVLDVVNQKQDNELDDAYRHKLLNGKLSKKGSAGLGFIDIRRKTGHRLEYHFLPIDDQFSFFLLDTVIPRKTAKHHG